MTIFLTGAGGLLGEKLALLWDRDQRVELTVSSRQHLPYQLSTSRHEIIDLTEKTQVHNMLNSICPDVVVHAAAMTHVDQCEKEHEACWQTNVTAVKNLSDACVCNPSLHFIYISSDFIFDGSANKLDEDTLPNPINYYGKSKWEAEKIISNSELYQTIVRTSLVYGMASKPDYSDIVLWVKRQLENGNTITMVDDQWRTPTLVDDLAMGCLLITKKRVQGIYHISGGELMTPYKMAIQTARFFGLDESLIKMTDSTVFKQPASRPLKTGLSISKAKNQLGYLPHTFEEGLAIVQAQWCG